jgi:cytochrome c oxidase assembly factor CtaG
MRAAIGLKDDKQFVVHTLRHTSGFLIAYLNVWAMLLVGWSPSEDSVKPTARLRNGFTFVDLGLARGRYILAHSLLYGEKFSFKLETQHFDKLRDI